MATFSTTLSLCFIIFCFNTTLNAEDQSRSFSFKDFSQDSNFTSQLSLYGDTKVIHGGSSLQLSTTGRVMYKKPFKLVENGDNPRRKMVSFSTSFVFSQENGDGYLAFVMAPLNFPFGDLGKAKVHNFLGVEFHTRRRDEAGSFVCVKVLKPRNVSSFFLNWELKSGAKIQAWVDYEASSKRLVVRLNKNVPLLSYPIDLSQMWEDTDVLVGFSASGINNNNSNNNDNNPVNSSTDPVKFINLYSWRFRSWAMPPWMMHSEPLDPKGVLQERQESLKLERCGVRFFSAMVFGIGCGVIGGLVLLFVWTMLGHRRPIVPEEEEEEEVECDDKSRTKIVVDNEKKSKVVII